MENLHNRRDPRVKVALDIVVQLPSETKRYRTKDISYRGVFIACPDPLPLRKLIRFQIVEPDSGEALQMLGLVAHRLNEFDAHERGLEAGMGLQLFSVGAYHGERWRALVREEYDNDPYAKRIMEMRERPHVKVHVATVEQLVGFANNDLFAGTTFLHTSDLHPAGEEVLLELVHPESQRTFLLAAQVTDVIEAPKQDRGIQLSFPPVDEELHARLQTFVRGDIE